jgi:hypothetical protein
MQPAGRPVLPRARGSVSEAVLEALRREPGTVRIPSLDSIDMFEDSDAQLALACCYELHYRSFAGVHDGWEWAPELLGLRALLEQLFVRRLEGALGEPEPLAPSGVLPALRALAGGSDGPSLSRYMEARGTLDNMREFCVHRSAYQLKEADPHTWMIPRLVGRSKAAAVTIQYDEYGAGSAPAMHSELFATTMRALGLDSTYGASLDLLPAPTLATGNLVTLFGLHRRWRAACAGHLALFEMTSVEPMERYANALRRFGLPEAAQRFYEVHVEADAWHEQIAQHELVGGLLADEPAAGGTVLFGARALMEVEGRMTKALIEAWQRGATSVLAPIDVELAAS